MTSTIKDKCAYPKPDPVRTGSRFRVDLAGFGCPKPTERKSRPTACIFAFVSTRFTYPKSGTWNPEPGTGGLEWIQNRKPGTLIHLNSLQPKRETPKTKLI